MLIISNELEAVINEILVEKDKLKSSNFNSVLWKIK